jgi:hypothetical protein
LESEAITSTAKDQRILSDSLLHELELSLLSKYIDDFVHSTGDDTFRLFYRDGLSAKAIAEKKGETVGTITSRLSRQRKRFKDDFRASMLQLRETTI